MQPTPPVTVTVVTAATPPKNSECSVGVKKTVYTRKKSTSAMHRKISAEFSHKNTSSAPAEDSKATAQRSGEESDSGPSSSSSPNGSSSSEKYLSPRVAHHPHAKHRHHHHPSSSLRKHVLVRRSPSPSTTMSPGYEQYQMALLEVPLPRDYGEASSDDLSSEWDSDAPDSRPRFIGNFKVKIASGFM